MKAPVTIPGASQVIVGSTGPGLGGIPSNVSKTFAVSGKYVTLLTTLNPGTIRVLVNGVWVPMTTGVRVDFPAAFTTLTVALSQALTNQIVGIYQTTGGMGAGPYVIFNLGVTNDPTPGTTI
jgi:hypothetical protein